MVIFIGEEFLVACNDFVLPDISEGLVWWYESVLLGTIGEALAD